MEHARSTGGPPAHAASGAAPVLELLHTRQKQHGCLREEDITEAASAAGLSPAEIYGALTAYSRFHLSPDGVRTLVCAGPACRMSGAGATAAHTDTGETHCLGLCDQPVAVLTADGPQIARASDRAALSSPVVRAPTVGVRESAFFAAGDPFDAVRDALKKPPENVTEAVAASGLLGRGGAAFPAGRKWALVRATPGDRKFVVCNADESEPGTFKDRCILDHQPRRLLAGMALAAHATGAREGVIYIRYEYGPQYERLLGEISRLRGEDLFGERFDVVVRRGAGSYVCGEETALLNSLEGKRPIPRDRPPYPISHGLFDAPTLIQNVETLTAVPAIAARGGAWFRDSGSPKLYCVSGDVPSPGVFELPMTVTARELVRMAGTASDGVKAFALGGLSGGLLPASALGITLDVAGPQRHAASLGSGGVIVLGTSRCPVRFTLDAMRFFAGESCGKCFPCRIGTTRLRERLETAAGPGALDIAEVNEIVDLLLTGSACGLGPAAGTVARHLVTGFADEVEAHRQGRCPTGECEATRG